MSVLLTDIDATCAALGYSDGERYRAEPDALLCLKHLTWILRRDSDTHEYRCHLGRSKVLQTDLVYMLIDYIGDDEFADVLIRLLIILTNPVLLLFREGPPKDNNERRIFLELIDISQGYKTAFKNEKIWAALCGKMQKPLEVDWSLRSEEQNLLIERILVLIRNVLQVPMNPEVECRPDNDASIHDQVIWALHRSGMLDMVLFIISSSDEHQFHLHGLEILYLLYREQTAESLADASLKRSATEKQRDEQELMAARRRDKQRLVARPPPGRHSRFGGTYVMRNMKSVSDRDIICHQPLERVISWDFDREKLQQKRSFRHVKEEAERSRRSACSVRLCLREYCIEILRSAYNNLVRQVRRVLEGNQGNGNHDDSYLLWAIRFFMEFNRLSGIQLQLVSESLSVQCFHWVLTRMVHHIEMITTDKKQARLWAKRLHVAIQTFRELLQSLLALQKTHDETAEALFDMLLNNVCYVMEYRETILHLLMNYNESHGTKAYLCDVVETVNIFIKIMEKFCKDTVVVQDKKRQKRRGGGKKSMKKSQKIPEETEEELANRWAGMAEEVIRALTNETALPEEQQPLPFDAASEKSIENQRDDCMIRIHKMLREEKLDHAVALLRSAREVWPENDVFGAISVAPEDELLLLREIFIHNIATGEKSSEDNETQENGNDDDNYDDADNEEMEEDDGTVEKPFKFDDFSNRLLNPRIVRSCGLILNDWEKITTKSLKATVSILHRIAYCCSCPGMLFHAKLFRIFQQVFHAARDAHHEELLKLGIFVVRKFVEIAPTNPKIYAELLFYKSIKQANELETGYCDDYERGTKGTWTEEQELELRFLFEENQRNPSTDQDVIDWILDNLIDKTRTRRGILKKLKELGLMFKAPTKRATASAANSKNLWHPEEDEELKSLYNQHRTENDVLQKIVSEFVDRRSKQQIIKRMLQLHLIADKSEIVPRKERKQKSKKQSNNEYGDSDTEIMEDELPTSSTSRPKTSQSKRKKDKKKNIKPDTVKRNVIYTPLDVDTIRFLLSQVDNEKYQEAIDWLKESLDEAAEDTEEPAQEDDGVPLLPLFEVQKDAMENDDFKKVLVALGIQPPIMGMESYWRIPTYLTSNDLKIRSKIIAGEEVDENVNESGDNNENDEGNSTNGDDSESETEVESDGDGEEEDYFDKLQKEREKGLEMFFENQRTKMDNLTFSNADNDEQPQFSILSVKKNKTETNQNETHSSSEDEIAFSRRIQKKLEKKRLQPDLTTDEESDDYLESIEKSRKKTKKEENPKTQKKNKETEKTNKDTKSLFDELKAKRANKTKGSVSKKPMVLESDNEDEFADKIQKKLEKKKKFPADLSSGEEIDGSPKDDHLNSLFEQLKKKNELNNENSTNLENENDDMDFNSEDYRKRLMELEDTDDDLEHVTANIAPKKRLHRIIPDSDESDGENELVANGNKSQSVLQENNPNSGDRTNTNQLSLSNDVDIDNDKITNDSSFNKKRRRSLNESGEMKDIDATQNFAFSRNTKQSKTKDYDDGNNEKSENNDDDDADEDSFFISRRKSTENQHGLIDTVEEPAKRRRLAILEDEDNDDY